MIKAKGKFSGCCSCVTWPEGGSHALLATSRAVFTGGDLE